MSLIFINMNDLSRSLKEDIRISIYLITSNKDSIRFIQQAIESMPYAKSVAYTNKEQAALIWNRDNQLDWSKVLQDNPLPESIDFYAKSTYVNQDSLNQISNELLSAFPAQISDIYYPSGIVNSLNQNEKKILLLFFVITVLFCIVVVFSIDNTIRLAMFSNRFIIKTMQLVGAHHSFILRPFLTRAMLNGFISSLIAMVGIWLLTDWIKYQFTLLQAALSILNFIVVFFIIIIIGIFISSISTYRSVNKYLKNKIEDLY